MDHYMFSDLVKSYGYECRAVNNLALQTVAEVQIPLCNNISSLSLSEFYFYLKNVLQKFAIFPIEERSLILTLLLDVATCKIKYMNFYGSDINKFKSIMKKLNVMTMNLLHSVKLESKDDSSFMLKHSKLMMKYIKRLPTDSYENYKINVKILYLELKKQDLDASDIQLQKTLIEYEQTQRYYKKLVKTNKYLNNNDVFKSNAYHDIKVSTEEKMDITIPDVNIKNQENFITNVYESWENINKNMEQLNIFNIEHKSNETLENNMEIDSKNDKSENKNVIEKKILSDQNCNTISKPKNAFSVMMNASKSKYKKSL